MFLIVFNTQKEFRINLQVIMIVHIPGDNDCTYSLPAGQLVQVVDPGVLEYVPV
jgi:hypothetical protein